jgi:hypothetical protein
MKRMVENLGRYLLENLELPVILSVFLCWEFLTGTPLNWRTAVVLVVLHHVLRVVEALRAGYKAGCKECSARAETVPKRVFLRDPEPVLRLELLGALEYHKAIGRYADKALCG